MRRWKIVLGWLFFFSGFFVAEIYRFSVFIFDQNHSFEVMLKLFFVAFLCGIALVIALAEMKLFPTELWKKLIYGGCSGVVIFFFIFGLEDALSDRRLYRTFHADEFSELQGHCGVYVGRALAKTFYSDWMRTIPHLLADYAISDRCRINHFVEAAKRGRIPICKDSEDEVQCRVRYMDVFSRKGFWSVGVRRMFLSEIRRLNQQDASKKIQSISWIEYLLKDQELNSARPSLLRQVGLDEQFSDDFIYLKNAEEYQELATTRQVMEEVTRIVFQDSEPDEFFSDLPAEMRLKFQDALKQAKLQIEKMPEMEKDLQELHKRVHPEVTI